MENFESCLINCTWPCLDSFIKGVTDLQWDCVKVVLRQPYNRNKQFGLEFLDIVETEVLESQKSNDSTKESSLAEFRRLIASYR